jgi:hypothetical protein
MEKNNMTKGLRTILINGVLLLFLSSCAAPSEPPEWFTNASCEAPCWQQISPGQTTRAEVLQSIPQIAFIDPTIVFTKGESWNGFSDIIFLPISEAVMADIDLRDDRVSIITFSSTEPGKNQLGLTVSDVITQYGEPDSIVRVRFTGRGWLPGSDARRVFVFILYTEKGIALGYDETSLPKRKHYQISPEIELSRLDYFYPEDFSFLLENGTFSQGNLDAQKTLQIMQPWVGYGDYSP